MAVTFDSTANTNSGTSSVSSLTWSHTVGAGTNSILLVGVSGAGPTTPGTIDNVFTIKYGGVSLTKINFLVENPGVSTGRWVDLYYLINPTPGTANIVATFITTYICNAGSLSFTGVNQSSPLGTNQTNGGTSVNSISTTTTGSTANDVVVAVMVARNSGTLTFGGSQTSRWNIINDVTVAGAGSTQTGGSSITSSFSWTTADNGAMVAVPVLNDGTGSGSSMTGVSSITGISTVTF